MLHTYSRQFDDISDAATSAALRGTNAAEHIKGDSSNNDIDGRGGDDVVLGRRGDDTLRGGSGADVVKGGKGDDHVSGGSGDDVVRGGLDNDHLKGGAGDDILRGGFGKDHLTGGAGADQFRVAGDGKMDIVTDFNFLQGDRINAVGFKLLGLHVDLGLGVTTATFDHNRDGIADASIRVNGILDVAGIIFGRQPPHAVAPAHAFAGHEQAAGAPAAFEAHHHMPLLDAAHLAIA